MAPSANCRAHAGAVARAIVCNWCEPHLLSMHHVHTRRILTPRGLARRSLPSSTSEPSRCYVGITARGSRDDRQGRRGQFFAPRWELRSQQLSPVRGKALVCESGGTFPSPKKASPVARAGRDGATMYPTYTPVAAGRNAKASDPSRAPTPSPEHRLKCTTASIGSLELEWECIERLTSPGVQPPLAERRVGPPVLPSTGARSNSSLSFNMMPRSSVARARRVRGALVCDGTVNPALTTRKIRPNHNSENQPGSELKNIFRFKRGLPRFKRTPFPPAPPDREWNSDQRLVGHPGFRFQCPCVDRATAAARGVRRSVRRRHRDGIIVLPLFLFLRRPPGKRKVNRRRKCRLSESNS